MVCCVGAGLSALSGMSPPVVGHGRRSAGRRGRRPLRRRGSGRLIAAPTGDGGCAKTPSVSGGRYTPLTPPPEGEARRHWFAMTRGTGVCCVGDGALDVPLSDMGAGRREGQAPPLRRTRGMRRTPSVTAALRLPLTPPPKGEARRTVGPSIARPFVGYGRRLAGDRKGRPYGGRGDPSVTGASAGDTSPCRGGKAHWFAMTSEGTGAPRAELDTGL